MNATRHATSAGRADQKRRLRISGAAGKGAV